MSEQKDKEISVEEKLRALFDLQLVKSEIDKIRTLRGELPLEVKDLQDEIEGLNTRAARLEEDIKSANATVNDKIREREECKTQIARYENQKNDIKNNREFDNLAKEIEYQELNITLADKKIKEFSNIAKEKSAELETTKERISERSADLAQKENELESITAETKQQEEELRSQALTFQEKIQDERMLNAFDKIRQNAHNGLAVVRVKRNSCGGCFNQIPPQRRIDIAQRKKLIVCEYCGRIMVDLQLGNEEVKKIGYGEEFIEKSQETSSAKTRKKA